MPFEIEGRGADVAVLVAGDDVAACLAAAVEGFAAVFTGVDPSAPRYREGLVVPGDDPAELLVTLIDELILRLDGDGQVGVGLEDAVVADGALRGVLTLVPVASARIIGAGPKAATWHGLRLAPLPSGGWQGEVLLDL